MLDATQILETAKRWEDMEVSEQFDIIESVGREDLRAVLWLVSTGRMYTITIPELEAAIENNERVRVNRI